MAYLSTDAIGPDGYHLGLMGRVFQPASWAVGSRATKLEEVAFSLLVPIKAAQTFRLFAGQADSHDQSHFTMSYELDDQRGIIDGWLRDGDRVEDVDGTMMDRREFVEFRIRSGPLKADPKLSSPPSAK